MRASAAVRLVAACVTGATLSVAVTTIRVARTAPAVGLACAMVRLLRGGGCVADRTTVPPRPLGTPGSMFRHLVAPLCGAPVVWWRVGADVRSRRQIVSATSLRAASPSELKEQLDAERRGVPFLVYRDGDGRRRIVLLVGGVDRLTIGRRESNDVSLPWDGRVSRVHAEV